MNDIFDEMEADAIDATAIPNDEKLEGIAGLAQEQVRLEAEVALQEEALKNLKKKLLHHQTHTLPEAMNEIGMAAIPLTDGTVIEIKPFVSASISAAKKEEAHTWLRDNGHEDLIKHTITVDVGRGNEVAAAAYEALSDLGLKPADKEAVHGGTLKVFVREQVEAAKPLPLELFGAFMGQKSTIVKKGK